MSNRRPFLVLSGELPALVRSHGTHLREGPPRVRSGSMVFPQVREQDGREPLSAPNRV